MRPYAFLVSVALFVAGVAFGTALDATPPRAPVERGGERVLEVDFHAHTRFSDGLLSPFDLVLQARRRGLDALAVTEHNNVFPGKMAAWFQGTFGGPIVIVGEEITTSKFHLHGVGLTEKVNPNQPLAGILDDIHRQGGVAIAAHPVAHFWPAFLPVRDRLDATEVMHPIAYGSLRGGGGGWRWAEMVDFYENARKEGFPIAAVGSSDYHFFSPLGVCRTFVFVPKDAHEAGGDAAAIVDAVKHGHTVVYDLDHNAYGDPDRIATLARDPLPDATHDYNYEGSGALDRVTRTVGWVGLVGIVLFRPRRRPLGLQAA